MGKFNVEIIFYRNEKHNYKKCGYWDFKIFKEIENNNRYKITDKLS